MAKKERNPDRTCADCIHEYQCQMWNMGTIHNMDATTCNGYETVKDSAAYLCGVLDERKRKRSNGDRIRSMTDEDLAEFMAPSNPKHDGFPWCQPVGKVTCRKMSCNECALGWLKQPAKEDAE